MSQPARYVPRKLNVTSSRRVSQPAVNSRSNGSSTRLPRLEYLLEWPRRSVIHIAGTPSNDSPFLDRGRLSRDFPPPHKPSYFHSQCCTLSRLGLSRHPFKLHCCKSPGPRTVAPSVSFRESLGDEHAETNSCPSRPGLSMSPIQARSFQEIQFKWPAFPYPTGQPVVHL